MDTRQALTILADGEFHSGEDIGRALGISRAAVWKNLSQLQEHGLALESKHRRGYRVPGGLDLLDREKILACMQTPERIDALDVLLETDSTNRIAMERDSIPDKAYVCTAEWQRQGRGRLGRTWVSPIANSIYLSAGWQFANGVADMQGLSLAVGVVVAQTLEQIGIEGVGLKWPNDLVADGKLGGILIELKGDLAGPCTAVIGIGLNGAVPEHSAEDIDIPFTDLRRLSGGTLPDRNRLVGTLLDNLMALLVRYPKEGLSACQQEWDRLDQLSGQPVTVHTGCDSVSGVARGIDTRGALQLETAQGIQSFEGGEVSLKAG
ncbi:MAG: biotin--[acetyl-CoA-carboxylase] ligase [Pseudomonadota bacterium]